MTWCVKESQDRATMRSGDSPEPKKQKMDQQELKRMCGYRAVDDYVKSGMVIGLGTGSTAYFAVQRVGEKLKAGELAGIVAVPTSEATRLQAESLSIPIDTLATYSVLDVAIDGADEVSLVVLNSFSFAAGKCR